MPDATVEEKEPILLELSEWGESCKKWSQRINGLFTHMSHNKDFVFTGRSSHLCLYFFFFLKDGSEVIGLTYWSNELNIYWVDEDTKTELYVASKLDVGNVNIEMLVKLSKKILKGSWIYDSGYQG